MEGLLPRGFAVLVAVAVAGCGGAPRQDADEPKGSFKLKITGASFPSDQQVAQEVKMRLKVRNTDSKTLPNVAMTVETRPKLLGAAPASFGQALADPRLADSQRPVWIVDSDPTGEFSVRSEASDGGTAYTNTWTLGRLRPGQTKTFEWRVTAIKPGRYTIDYKAAPSLDGKARLAAGSKASGSFRVRIDGGPVDARVADDGSVERKRDGSFQRDR